MCDFFYEIHSWIFKYIHIIQIFNSSSSTNQNTHHQMKKTSFFFYSTIHFKHQTSSIKAKNKKKNMRELNTYFFCVCFINLMKVSEVNCKKQKEKNKTKFKKKLRSSGGEFKVVGQTIEKKELRG